MTSRLWFMAARQRRISFVASVFPEPLSPLAEQRPGASARLCLSVHTPTQEPCSGPEVPSTLPRACSRLASHHPGVWMQTYCPGCSSLSPTRAQPGSPDDDTLVLFGIKHFGEGEISNCKEVPGETGHWVSPSLTVSSHSPTVPGIGEKSISVQPAASAARPSPPVRELQWPLGTVPCLGRDRTELWVAFSHSSQLKA